MGKELEHLIGEVIKELRLSKNLSQEKLAELSNLDRSYISEIERGVKTASVVTIFKISAALSIKSSELLQKVEKHIKFTDKL